MREILFRGKRKDNGEWVYGYYVRTAWYLELEGYMDIIIPIDSILYSRCEINEYFEIIPETVGQFTGLVDKNDVKIFEGDIIRIHHNYSGNLFPFNAVVMYKDGAFISCGEHRANYDLFNDWNTSIVWWEIIGNIHDNPEMLDSELLEKVVKGNA